MTRVEKAKPEAFTNGASSTAWPNTRPSRHQPSAQPQHHADHIQVAGKEATVCVGDETESGGLRLPAGGDPCRL